MVRTTPPRPVNVVAVFPEVAEMARTATRLHPRRGHPTVHDSSVGGPLLWPADEAWPVCAAGGDHEAYELTTLADVRTLRRILVAAWARPRSPRTNLLTAEEEAVVDRIHDGYPLRELPGGPLPMIPVAQLYARDVPDLPCPEGMDLLQVLWCPFPDVENSSSAMHLRWRRSADVTDVLRRPPEPAFVGGEDYVPFPCLLHPEQVTEYQVNPETHPELAERFYRWIREQELNYDGDLSIAPGWKIGGWPARWTFTDPPAPEYWRCEECGAPVDALLTIDSSEWDGASGSWRPLEDDPDEPGYPSAYWATMVTIGRGYTLQVYRCTNSVEHPPLTFMQ
ncbi:hypothetical protein DPM19_00930 [Actinomadura craniellae]|uniref:DUF1963 domain-containing protein n=2 Tax=Actinomadura craniellae TaxID=2231787 RepID=A0A365HE24_9ACTN|nr:hypothetical protein DPM19_00930 [Actinomadura craniellae]